MYENSVISHLVESGSDTGEESEKELCDENVEENLDRIPESETSDFSCSSEDEFSYTTGDELEDTNHLTDQAPIVTSQNNREWIPEVGMKVAIHLKEMGGYFNAVVLRYIRTYKKWWVQYDDGQKREEVFNINRWILLEKPSSRSVIEKRKLPDKNKTNEQLQTITPSSTTTPNKNKNKNNTISPENEKFVTNFKEKPITKDLDTRSNSKRKADTEINCNPKKMKI